MTDRESVVGYVPGVFDMFHIGHLNILRRSHELCDVLVAGVVTDEACEAMKGYLPIIPFAERTAIIASNRYVDAAVADGSADKRDAWNQRRFDVIFKGSDWADTEKGRQLEAQMSEVGARVEYLPYTDHTSSTLLRETLARLATAL